MESDVASRKLFIGGLSYGTDDDKLKSYFEQYGTVQDAVVMKDPVTKRSRGFGFITYTHTSHVDQALSAGVHVIDSRKVEAKRAVPRHEVVRDQASPTAASSSTTTTNSSSSKPFPNNSHHHNQQQQQNSNGNNYQNNNNTNNNNSNNNNQQQQQQQYHNDLHINSDEYAYCKIFVGGLHYDTRDGEFRHYFEKYGRVISAEVMFNRETHKSRGFGFIIFDNEDSVDRVCEEKDHSIDGKTVEVKRAVPRSKIGVMNVNTTTGSGTNNNNNTNNSTGGSSTPTNSNTNLNNLAAFPPVSPLNKNTVLNNNNNNNNLNVNVNNNNNSSSSIASAGASSISSSNSVGQKNTSTPGTSVNNNVNANTNTTNSSIQAKKPTPGTPPTSYAAVVISGPQASSSNASQQSSQTQSTRQSPSFGPIGSPTHGGNSNSSFGMMLPPTHLSNNNNNNSMSGTNSLNNSTHGSGNFGQSPYRSHSSSISDLSEPYQNHHQQHQHQQLQMLQQQQQQQQNKLLQHQEQFPPPSSPLRSMTSNYPPLSNSSFISYSHLAIPNPSHLRNRALSESYLSLPPHKSFQLSLSMMTPSPDLPYPPLLPSNLDGTNDNFEETSPNKLNDFNIQLSSENTPTDDTIGNSTWSPSKLSSTSGNKESQLESLFASNRQDIERSVSLGGLGWMPSSLSTHNHPPPQSRRGFSDLGVGIGFGNDNTDRDVSFGFNLPDLVETDHQQQLQQQQQQQQQLQYHQQQSLHQYQQHQHHIQQQQQQQQQQLNNPFIPSMSAWESFIDQAINVPNISPPRPHSYSLNNLHDGLSPNSNRHYHLNMNIHNSLHYNTQNNSQSSTTTSNSILNSGIDDNDDNSYCIQELRLQAPEYTPGNIHSSSSSTSSPWLSR